MAKRKVSRNILKKPRRTRQDRERESENVHRAPRKQTTLTSPKGQDICKKIRREAWFQLMSSSPDQTYRHLAASILLASAVLEVKGQRPHHADP